MLAVALTLACGACRFGGNPRQLALAHQPRGVEIDITTNADRVTGELLAVSDTGLTVLGSGEIAVVRYAAIKRVEARTLRVLASRRYPLSVQQRDRLRLYARYPQGIDDDLLRRLLEGYGLTEPKLVSQ